MQRLGLLAAFVLAAPAAVAGEAMCRVDHAAVSYAGIDRQYAQAIARAAAAARAVAVDQFGFDMPETVRVRVRCDRKAGVRLYTNGQDRLFLTVRAQADLRKPADSGVFHLYGICHEVGHLAMYRLIRDHGWMTTAAAEGWAHYLGSRITDGVHAREGKDLWPDEYDYLVDGTKRLNRQLAGKKPTPVTQGARLWKKLAEIVGDKGLVKVLRAWGKANVDRTDPGAALRKALLAANADKRLAAWWDMAEPVLVFKRPKSGFTARTARRGELTGQPVELVDDDGIPSDKRSIAGGGHAVRCSAGGAGWYLTSVKIYGSRYGYPRPPREDFHIWVCDVDFKTIAEFPFPYAKFARKGPKWVKLTIRPTEVPAEFIICVGFNPTATKGVFVHHDRESGGNSLTGLPGRPGREFTRGDWLIRATIDQLEIANPLKPPKQERINNRPARTAGDAGRKRTPPVRSGR